MAYARFSKPAQDAAGNVLTNVWCEVRREDVGTLPLEPLFSDRAGAVPLSNPFLAADGVPSFYCAGGAFQIRYYKTGYDETFPYVGIGLASESDLQGFVPMGEWDDATTYTISDVVTVQVGVNRYMYASKVNDNLNNVPDSTPPLADTAYWAYLGSMVAPTGEPIFILAPGQSNNMLRLTYSWTPPTNLRIWDFDGTVDAATKTGTSWLVPDGTWISNALSEGAEAARNNPNSMVYVFQIAIGGLALTHWMVGTPAPDMYACTKANVEAGLALVSGTRIHLMDMFQGEMDAALGSVTYASDHKTVMTRFRAETWFPTDTPILVRGLSSHAGATFANFNRYLMACVAEDPDFLRYVHTGALPIALFDPSGSNPYIHALAEGYYQLGQMGYRAWHMGGGRNAPKGLNADPENGNILVGPSGIPAAGEKFVVRHDQNTITYMIVDNQDAGSAARAIMGARTDAGIATIQVNPVASGGGSVNLGWNGSGPYQYVLTNAASYYRWYSSGVTLRMTLAVGGNLGVGPQSTPDRRIHSEVDDASNNTVTQALRITHTTSGTPGNGIGVGMEFEVETSAANNEVGATINAVAVDTTATSEDFDLTFNLMAAGAAVAEVARFKSTGEFQMGSTPATVITASRHHQHRSYTVGTLPSAAVAGQEIYVSDESGGAVLAFSDGTNWRRVTDRAIVS